MAAEIENEIRTTIINIRSHHEEMLASVKAIVSITEKIMAEQAEDLENFDRRNEANDENDAEFGRSSNIQEEQEVPTENHEKDDEVDR